MTDWNDIARRLKNNVRHAMWEEENKLLLDQAISLCQRMAKGELVEREGRREIVEAQQTELSRLKARVRELEQAK